MGARVRGAGSPVIVIDGVEQLQGVDYHVIPDRIEAATQAEMTFGYEDETTISIGGGKGEEGTKLTVGGVAEGKRLTLHAGLLKAQVAPQAGGWARKPA